MEKNKKIFFIIVLLILLIGGGGVGYFLIKEKPKENNAQNNEKSDNNNATIDTKYQLKNEDYYNVISYEMLKDAYNKKEKSFIVFFYDDNDFYSRNAKPALKKYAKENKVEIYELNMPATKDKYFKDNSEGLKKFEEEYVPECLTFPWQPTTDDTDNKYNKKYMYTEDECLKIAKSNFWYNRYKEIYKEFDIEKAGDIIYIDKGSISSKYQDFLDVTFPLRDKETQAKILERETMDLYIWLDGKASKM